MSGKTNVTFYLEGIPASKSDPFTINAGGSKVGTLSEKLSENEQKVWKATVNSDETENEELFLTVHLQMQTKGVDHKQKINLTQGGTHIKIAFVEETFKISTSKKSFNPESKDEEEDTKVERVYFKLIRVTPFTLYLGSKLIYKLKKDVKGSKEVDLNVKLSSPERYVNLKLLGDEEKVLLAKKMDVGGNGEFMKITTNDKGELVVLQRTKDGKYEEKEDVKPDSIETKIYFLGVEFDKENKLGVYMNGKKIHTLSKKEDPIAGVKVDLPSDSLKKKILVKGGKENLKEEKEIDFEQGSHVLMSLSGDGKVEWKQSSDQFKFGYQKNEDGTQTIKVLEE